MKGHLLALGMLLAELVAWTLLALAVVAMVPSEARGAGRDHQRVHAPLDYAQRSMDKTIIHDRGRSTTHSAPAGSGTRHVYQPTRDHQRGDRTHGRTDRQDYSRRRR